MKMNHRYLFFFVAAAVVVAGCSKSGSAPTSASNENQPTMTVTQQSSPPPALPPGHPTIDMSAQTLPSGATAQEENPQWTVPSGWEPGPSSSVRRGSWTVKGPDGQSADVAVTAFPGDVGGLLANLNRWRAQIGVPPVTADQVASITSNIDVSGTSATVVDFTADKPAQGKTQPQRMVVVTLSHAGNSWFFKMTGDAPLIETQKDTLLQFVKSVKF
jgi:hypothetical protein